MKKLVDIPDHLLPVLKQVAKDAGILSKQWIERLVINTLEQLPKDSLTKADISIWQFKSAARELNELMEPDPPIDVHGRREDLIEQLREVSEWVVNEEDVNEGDTFDVITDQTLQVLNSIAGE